MKKQTIDSLVTALSDPRFETYKARAGNDRHKALELYLWNIDMSRAVAATTGMVEVQLRNSINQALADWNQEQDVTTPGRSTCYSADWLQDPAPRLAQIINPPKKLPLWQSALAALKDENGNFKKRRSEYTHDDFVAALTFGTWTYLLPKPNTGENNPRRYLWEHALKNSFSARNRSGHDHESHTVIYHWANSVRYARNRANHLEPLLDDREVTWYHRASLRLLNSMNPAAASWLAGQSYIPSTLRARPF